MEREKKSLFEQMSSNLKAMAPDQKAKMGRIIRGEDKDDLLRREDVRDAIRSLRTNPVPSAEYQKALTDVQRMVTDLPHVSRN